MVGADVHRWGDVGVVRGDVNDGRSLGNLGPCDPYRPTSLRGWTGTGRGERRRSGNRRTARRQRGRRAEGMDPPVGPCLAPPVRGADRGRWWGRPHGRRRPDAPGSRSGPSRPPPRAPGDDRRRRRCGGGRAGRGSAAGERRVRERTVAILDSRPAVGGQRGEAAAARPYRPLRSRRSNRSSPSRCRRTAAVSSKTAGWPSPPEGSSSRRPTRSTAFAPSRRSPRAGRGSAPPCSPSIAAPT